MYMHTSKRTQNQFLLKALTVRVGFMHEVDGIRIECTIGMEGYAVLTYYALKKIT